MRMTDWRTDWWCCIDRDIVWQSDNCRPCACPLHYCYYYYWWWWSCWDWWCITSTSWLHCWFNRIQRWDRTVSTSHCSTYYTVLIIVTLSVIGVIVTVRVVVGCLCHLRQVYCVFVSRSFLSSWLSRVSSFDWFT